MKDFSEADIITKQCRIIPMIIAPGKIQGSFEIQAMPCVASACAHWYETVPGKVSALDARFNEQGRGFCALDGAARFVASYTMVGGGGLNER